MEPQNIAFNLSMDIAGLLGFLISITTLIHLLITRRKRLTVNFGLNTNRDYFGKNYFIIYCRFDNLSELPISITRIQILIDNIPFDCYHRPLIVETSTYKEAGKVTDQYITYSDTIPINLNSLASHSGFLAFQVPQDKLLTDGKSLTFRICTNRGKAVQKTFELHEDQKLL